MATQNDINSAMRGILIDWLIEVAVEFNLQADTLYTTVNYIDRYLSTWSVPRGRLQLLGVTSMLIASKYEEIYSPSVEEYVFMTDNTYTKKQVADMELEVLLKLKFQLTVVTPNTFLSVFIAAAKLSPEAAAFAKVLLSTAKLTL
jgi:cyclin-A